MLLQYRSLFHQMLARKWTKKFPVLQIKPPLLLAITHDYLIHWWRNKCMNNAQVFSVLLLFHGYSCSRCRHNIRYKNYKSFEYFSTLHNIVIDPTPTSWKSQILVLLHRSKWPWQTWSTLTSSLPPSSPGGLAARLLPPPPDLHRYWYQIYKKKSYRRM